MCFKLKWIAPLFILLSLFSVCAAQTRTTDTLETRVKNLLSNYYKKYPQEKIFVHTSQNGYASGQTIWYKIYAAAYGKPSALSKIVYLQLAGINGKILAQQKLPLTNGHAFGNIDLPDSLKTGWYQLRGFTGWMMNFDEDGYYHQNIYIQNTSDTIHHALRNTSPKKYRVSFFPEGGDMVDGNPCNVAFKATDADGMPVTIYGEVQDNTKKTIAALVTTHDGMGIFGMEPAAGNAYTAVIRFPDNTEETMALPAVKKEGLSFTVNPASADEIQLKIMFSGAREKYKDVLLTAFQNNGLIATYPLELSRGINVFSIKKNEFATGILRLTLFDHTGVPAAERLVFINNHNQLKLQLKADTISLMPHQKQVFSLAASGADHQPLNGNFSVSVTDADADAGNNANTIYSSLLLDSELRGYINKPAWYFMNNSDTLSRQLDLVMLTSGWRHFKWEQVFKSNDISLHYPVEKTQFIAGKILGYHKPLTEKDQFTIKLLIMNQDSSKYIGYVTPDSTGSFILNDYAHAGKSTLYMETADKKNHVKKLGISLFSTLADSLKNTTAPPFSITENEGLAVSNYLLANAITEKRARYESMGIMLKTVVVKDKKLTPTQEVINDHVSPLYRAMQEYTLDLVNNPSLDIGFINYIRGRFPGLMIDGKGNFVYLSSSTFQQPKDKSDTGGMQATDPVMQPYFFLNEAPVKDLLTIESIPMQDIALIRFLPPPVACAPYNGGNVGAILVYTKDRADDARRFIASNESFNQFTFNGYTITREFSSPDYSHTKTVPPPDNRTTLYWNHDLDTDGTGHAGFNFYNTDKTKRFRVVIQGMDSEGRLGYFEGVF